MSLSPATIYFGDPVTARLDVFVDRTEVDVKTIQVSPSFGSWEQLTPPRSSSTTGGKITEKTWQFTIVCLTFACVPKSTSVQEFHLPALTLTGQNVDGSTFKIQRGWPALNVAGRFPPAPGNNVVPAFILQSKVPPPSYRLDPSALSDALDITGFLIIALALGACARLFARRWVRRDPAVENGVPLARALALVRVALTREPADRRRAVGLLARTLPTEDTNLSSIAIEVAWSQPEPSPSRIEELLRVVEAEYEEST
jgi:hypothetical protein